MTAMRTTWVLEHPSCSLLHKHDRFEWLLNSVLYAASLCNLYNAVSLFLFNSYCSKVYSQAFWLMHWGSPSPKRTKIYSNSPRVKTLDRGVLKKNLKAAKTKIRTTRSLAASIAGEPSEISVCEIGKSCPFCQRTMEGSRRRGTLCGHGQPEGCRVARHAYTDN